MSVSFSFVCSTGGFNISGRSGPSCDTLAPEHAVASAMIKERTEAGLTQAELAEKAGMTQAQVSRLESGQWPTPATIEKLARALGKRAELRFV